MRAILTAITGAAAAAAAVGALAAAPAIAKPRLSPQAQLEKALEGRVAGEPVSCIQLSRVRSSRIIDDTAIVYDAGNTIYVNHPRSGAESLDQWDTLVTKTFGGDLCRVDVVQLYDRGLRMPTGLVFLGDFVPYKRVSARN